jgi:hypothetical protein
MSQVAAAQLKEMALAVVRHGAAGGGAAVAGIATGESVI